MERKRISEKCVSNLDVFGMSMNLNVSGHQKFKTKCGAAVSFIMIFFMTILYLLLGALWAFDVTPFITMRVTYSDLESLGPLSANQIIFDVAYSLKNSTGHALDPNLFDETYFQVLAVASNTSPAGF